MPGITMDEKYQAEWDAQSLADAEKIKSDPKRYANAQHAAVRLAEEEREKAKAMSKVAGGRSRGISMDKLKHKPVIEKAATMPTKTGYNVFEKI